MRFVDLVVEGCIADAWVVKLRAYVLVPLIEALDAHHAVTLQHGEDCKHEQLWAQASQTQNKSRELSSVPEPASW